MGNADVIGIQNATTVSKAGQPARGSGDELGKSDFLNLLMAQMSAQDPLDPMNNEAFIQQLTSFANLEELQNMRKQFEELLNITSAGNQASMVSLLGRDVRISGGEFQGPGAKVHYKLPEPSSDIVLEVRDENNLIVKVIDDVPGTQGEHTVDLTGLKDGKLKFSINAKNMSGEEIEAELSVTESVSGVNFANNIPVIITESGRQISAGDLVEIYERTRADVASKGNSPEPSPQAESVL